MWKPNPLDTAKFIYSTYEDIPSTPMSVLPEKEVPYSASPLPSAQVLLSTTLLLFLVPGRRVWTVSSQSFCVRFHDVRFLPCAPSILLGSFRLAAEMDGRLGRLAPILER